MIQEERVAYLSEKTGKKGRYILCWMQAAPRVTYNHAYQYAMKMAERYTLPLIACFDLVPGYPGVPHARSTGSWSKGSLPLQLSWKCRESCSSSRPGCSPA